MCCADGSAELLVGEGGEAGVVVVELLDEVLEFVGVDGELEVFSAVFPEDDAEDVVVAVVVDDVFGDVVTVAEDFFGDVFVKMGCCVGEEHAFEVGAGPFTEEVVAVFVKCLLSFVCELVDGGEGVVGADTGAEFFGDMVLFLEVVKTSADGLEGEWFGAGDMICDVGEAPMNLCLPKPVIAVFEDAEDTEGLFVQHIFILL
jgi:hypothetical protein